jgi:hypothetical protein
MQTVSGKNKPVQEGEDRWKDLRTKIEAQSEATYSTARIWVRDPIHPISEVLMTRTTESSRPPTQEMY